MAQARTSATGAVDMQLDLMSDLFVDEKRAVTDVSTRFEAALKKSDKLKVVSDMVSVAKVVRDMVSVEEARLNGARVRLVAARDSLTAYSLAKLVVGREQQRFMQSPRRTRTMPLRNKRRRIRSF